MLLLCFGQKESRNYSGKLKNSVSYLDHRVQARRRQPISNIGKKKELVRTRMWQRKYRIKWKETAGTASSIRGDPWWT